MFGKQIRIQEWVIMSQIFLKLNLKFQQLQLWKKSLRTEDQKNSLQVLDNMMSI